MLEEIAAAEQPTPELVRRIFPDREPVVSYLEEKGLLNDTGAQFILANLNVPQAAPKKETGVKQRKPAISPAALTKIVYKVATTTGFQKREINRVVKEILTPGGRLMRRWRERVISLLGRKVREPVEAGTRSKNAQKKAFKKRSKRKAKRRARK
jgi:hypothetical protein